LCEQQPRSKSWAKSLLHNWLKGLWQQVVLDCMCAASSVDTLWFSWGASCALDARSLQGG